MSTLAPADTPLRDRRGLAAQLVDALRQRIERGDYLPGDRLPTEQDLCRSFAVSRSVVREAISSLRAAGLVTTRHGVGAFVSEPQAPSPLKIDPADLVRLDDVLAVLELRIGLETEAAALAARRRAEPALAAIVAAHAAFGAAIDAGEDAAAEDRELHRGIALATGNPHFVDILASLASVLIPRTRVDLFHGETREQRGAFLRTLHHEHGVVVEAIARQDAAAAATAMRTHLEWSRSRIVSASARGRERASAGHR